MLQVNDIDFKVTAILQPAVSLRMYDLFVSPARRFTGAFQFPELPYLRRSYAGQLVDVKQYYRRYPKRVDSDNRLGNLLTHLPRRWDLDDRRYVRYIEDVGVGVLRAFGVTSSTYRGRVFEDGITLGPKTNEVLLATLQSFSVDQAARQWRNWTPLWYLYHTRADLGLPILNNTSPGRGHGVSVLHLPMLALQYRYWLIDQKERYGEQPESVYRFIGSYVLPNALDSYLDIAFFNRVARQARGIGTPRFPTPHPFYLTDYSQRVERLGAKVLETQPHRSGDLEQVVNTTPMLVKGTLWEVLRYPKDPVTRANAWALYLARLPYIRYLVETALRSDQGDRHFTNELYTSLIEANNDSIFSGVGSAEIIIHYRKQLRGLLAELEARGQGWT